jgi:hypothetical protein
LRQQLLEMLLAMIQEAESSDLGWQTFWLF